MLLVGMLKTLFIIFSTIQQALAWLFGGKKKYAKGLKVGEGF